MLASVFFLDLLSFTIKTVVIIGVIGALFVLVAVLVARSQQSQELQVEPLNDEMKQIGAFLKNFRLSKDEAKAEAKKRKEEKKKAKTEEKKKLLYVLRFEGDIKATQVENLREEVNAILQAAQPGDEVLCVLESPGGVVHGYGLAASQLQRIRNAGLHLTAAVDEVAASGGYMMACVANQIIAAPFAIIGSIGVVAQVPNFYRLLKKNDVEYREYTAGEYKRTVSLFGEITPKGEEKFLEQLEETHQLFQNHVSRNRPQVDIKSVATGEYWYGERALQLGLVDALRTSDDFLLEKLKQEVTILEIRYEKAKSFQEKLSGVMGKAVENSILRLWTKLESQKFL